MRGRSIVAIAGLLSVIATACLAPASAAADGAPAAIPAVHGVTDLAGTVRYDTFSSGNRTVVARIAVDGGEVLRYRPLDGRWMVAGVAADGSGTGISADGQTLVLAAQPRRYPIRETTLLVLDAKRFDTLDRIPLEGSFGLDAVSPDGEVIYLIESLDARDATRYAVRAYDREARRLLPDPILDHNAPDEQMQGFPISRAMSPDGRYAYTLYDGNGGMLFIHMLDTAHGTAHCVDLEALAGVPTRRLYQLTLDVDSGGGTVLVADRRGGTSAVLDTATLEVTVPPSGEPTADADGGPGGTLPWLLAVGVTVIATVVAATAIRRRRPAST